MADGVNGAGEVVDCEVCILGGGIAGLNALFGASRTLAPKSKIVMVDRRDTPAGMWHSVYPYVRLHQPHPVFTAGDIAWQGQADPRHLATRDEVVDHLSHCYQVLRGRCDLDARFGHEYEGHEDSGQGERPLTITCRRGRDGAPVIIRARRLIKAFGYNVAPQAALSLSSRAVRSVSPDHYDLFGEEMQRSDAPVYVVGGGKTGMDTAHALIRRFPNKRIRMLIGDGTMFMNRDELFPRGLGIHYQGHTALEVFLDVITRFDGRNEQAVMDHFRRHHAVSLDSQCKRFMFGTLSQAENEAIKRGLDATLRAHLQDVVDGPDGPRLVLRSGEQLPVEPGSIFVNTTGYIRGGEYEPYLSSTSNVLSIQTTSTTHFLSSQAAYFLTPLFLRGKLAGVPLYEMDLDQVRAASRDVFPVAGMLLTVYNTSVLLKHLPKQAIDENGLDLMRFMPTHRRLLAIAKLLAYLKLRPNHMPHMMDQLRQRLGVRLGPFEQHAAGSASPVPQPRAAAGI